uniref:Uncharacterized protein n=1 Tax=Alexandrium monilatum TaxID=311494 RepID=A0A7S4RZD8_9DINO
MLSEPAAKRPRTGGEGRSPAGQACAEEAPGIEAQAAGAKGEGTWDRQLSDASTAASDEEPVKERLALEPACGQSPASPVEERPATRQGPIGVFDWCSWGCMGGPEAATSDPEASGRRELLMLPEVHQPRTLRELLEYPLA